ncbi:MAG TPA: hypothetical protein VK465_04505, partial [Fibrobacteria bacterium]|nr:hypothetical protein [Fibrobacteria bacterium]
RVSASSATPDLGLASPLVADVAPGSNHVVSFEALDTTAFTQAVKVDGSPVAFNSGSSSYELPPVRANQQVVVTFVSRSMYSLLTLSTTAFQGSSATPPLCLGKSDKDDCSKQGDSLISRGMPIGKAVQVTAPESFCPTGNNCSNEDRKYFKYWQDRATNRQYDNVVLMVNITKDDLHLEAVYASRGIPNDSLINPPILLNQGAGTSQGN